MNRRGFLSAILGSGAAMVLDPERLLWRPGAKLISIPIAPLPAGTISPGYCPENCMKYLQEAMEHLRQASSIYDAQLGAKTP